MEWAKLCFSRLIFALQNGQPLDLVTMCAPNSQQYKGYTAWQHLLRVLHVAQPLGDVVRKLCRDRTSEACPCREKWHESLRCFSDFWRPNALLTANLCDNPANLWVNDAFLGNDRPYDGVGMV